MRTIDDITERVRAEYLEMPGMRLKAEQVQRLCGVEQKTCQIALDTLVTAKFLFVNSDGHYARLTDGQFFRPRPAKTEFSTDTRSKKAS